MLEDTNISQETGGVNESNQAQKQTGGESEDNQTSKKTGGKTVKLGDFDVPEDILQGHIDSVIKARINEVKDKEREKYKDYADLKAAKARLDEIEREKLSEEEKKKAALDKLQAQIDAKEKELADRNLRDLKRSKIEQAIADGKMEVPKGKTINDLIKRCLAVSEADIDTDIDDLASLFPKSEPSKAIGGGSQTPATKPNDIKTQIDTLTAKASDPKLSATERTRVQEQILALKLQSGGTIPIR